MAICPVRSLEARELQTQIAMLPDFDFDLATMVDHLIHMAIAFVLAFPVAWDREHEVKTMGMRTFPLVAMGSCAFFLLGIAVAEGRPEALARVLSGIMTGVGFLGGGAIVKQGMTVRGAATAAAIWITAGLGASVAYRRYEIAILLAVLAFAVLRWLTPLKELARDEDDGDQPETPVTR